MDPDFSYTPISPDKLPKTVKNEWQDLSRTVSVTGIEMSSIGGRAVEYLFYCTDSNGKRFQVVIDTKGDRHSPPSSFRPNR